MTHDTNTHIDDTTPRRLGLRGLVTKLTRREAPIRLDRRAGFAAAALAVSALSAVFFLVADGLPLLLVGRVVSGLSASIFTGTATATLLDSLRRGGEPEQCR